MRPGGHIPAGLRLNIWNSRLIHITRLDSSVRLHSLLHHVRLPICILRGRGLDCIDPSSRERLLVQRKQLSMRQAPVSVGCLSDVDCVRRLVASVTHSLDLRSGRWAGQ